MTTGAPTTAQLDAASSASDDADRAATQLFADVVIAILMTAFIVAFASGLYILFCGGGSSTTAHAPKKRVTTSTVCGNNV